MAVNIHITIIELNALHTKGQNLFQELDAVIHLLMEAKHWGLRKSRNATSLNSRFKSLDTLKVKIISVTFRRVIRTNHKKASKIWRHENIAYQQKESTARVASIMENTNLSKQQQVSEIMRQMLTQAQTAGQYFTNDQIKEMTRKVSAEVDLVHQQTQNQRYGSSHIGATAKDISNV